MGINEETWLEKEVCRCRQIVQQTSVALCAAMAMGMDNA